SVLARGLVDTAHPDHRVLTGAVDSARRRLGITLGRLESLSDAAGEAVDVAADLVVVVLLRLLVEVAVGQDERAAVDECSARLRVVLAGEGTITSRTRPARGRRPLAGSITWRAPAPTARSPAARPDRQHRPGDHDQPGDAHGRRRAEPLDGRGGRGVVADHRAEGPAGQLLGVLRGR